MHRSAAKMTKGLVGLLVAVLIVSLAGSVEVGAASSGAASAPGDQIFYVSGDLVPGETNRPSFPAFATRAVNLKLMVPAVPGDGSISLTFYDGLGDQTFAAQVLDGETVWATITIKPGYNEFVLRNVSDPAGPDLEYEMWLYEVDQAPFTWSGTSLGEGSWRSHIQAKFPTSGLYQFGLGVASGRYQLLVDEDYIQKTAEAPGTVTYYVSAGTHDLYVMPQTTAGSETGWSVTVSGPGAGSDSLPYSKTGGNLGGSDNDFTDEWLPLDLSAATKANFKLALVGESSQALQVDLYGETGTVPLYTISNVYGGETVWWTADLPAGVSRIQLEADSGNTTSLAYTLTVQAEPSPPASWAGLSVGGGTNSQVRLEISTAGLYDLAYGVTAGRYQFLVDSDVAIQKTVESAGTVRYYLSAGTHELTIVQDDSALTTEWSFEIAGTGAVYDTLPYQKTGGNLGGTGNQFVEEWLPLNVQTGGAANFELALDGDPSDGAVVTLYQGENEVYSTPVVYGGETFWWPAALADGLNHVKVTAEGNAGALAYDLTVHSVPSPPGSWSGEAQSGAGNSVVQLNVATTGTYTVTLETPTGFAQVLVDGVVVDGELRLAALSRVTEFLAPLSAGDHRFQIVQSAAYPSTEWTLKVESAVAGDVLARFTGSLAVGEQVDPQLPLFGKLDKAVNFRLAVTGGGPLNLTIDDGSKATAFTGSALAGETVWGTAVLKPGQNTFTFLNSGAGPLDYELTVYEVGQAPYEWAGASMAAGTWDSRIKLNFPSGALYTLDFGVLSGRYQVLVDEKYIQKIAEADGQVSYFVPAGYHLVTVVPDRSGADTSWAMAVSAPGAANDTLPYTRSGRDLWPTSSKFNEEWLPLNLADAVKANFKLTLAGSKSDALGVGVYSGMGATEVYSLTGVHGGETVWWTADLPAGVSRIQLMADPANAASLAYTLTVEAAPDLPAGWAGVSYGEGNHSQVRFNVGTAGLYDITYDVNSPIRSVTKGIVAGRYQFLVDSDVTIQKTVESAGTVRYYLSAGTHELTVVQDEGALITDWSLEIAGTGETYDTLPYEQTGGNLGGMDNPFVEEWLPLYVEEGGPANFELTLDGDLRDGLVASLYQGATEVYSTPVVYGGETFWWPATLAGGVNQIKLTAAKNLGLLAYDLSVHAVPMVTYDAPYTWNGVSNGAADKREVSLAHSEVEIHTPVSATYHVSLDVPNGFATMRIEGSSAVVQTSRQSHLEFDVPLDEGSYFFGVVQSPDYVTTTWAATVSLKSAMAPQIVSIDPAYVRNGVDHPLTIVGANFQPGAVVTIDQLELGGVTWLDSATLKAVIPAGTPAGTYSVTVENPDGKLATLPDALEVAKPQYLLYLPMVTRNNE